MARALRLPFLLAAALAAAPGALAQQPSADVALSPGRTFAEPDGEALYAHVCSACHMPGATGAVGAAAYPALARNAALEPSGYLVTVVVRGLRGMPAFGRMMSDEQVAAVVNYVRTHFGNDYRDVVTPEEVKAARP